MGKNRAKEKNCAFYETSALNNTGIDEVFNNICEVIYNKMKNELKNNKEDDDIEIVKGEDKIVNIEGQTKTQKKCCK